MLDCRRVAIVVWKAERGTSTDDRFGGLSLGEIRQRGQPKEEPASTTGGKRNG
jgi:hypothetical protein